MRRAGAFLTWIWFAGAAAWLFDAAISMRLRAYPRAELALMVAMLFFVAGLFYRSQRR